MATLQEKIDFLTRRAIAYLLAIAILLTLCLPVQAQIGDAAWFVLGPQLPLTSSWFDATQVAKGRLHADAFPAVPATGDQFDPYLLAHYYDLGLTTYQLYARTKDPADLARARKVCDSWWQNSYIKGGAVRRFDVEGPAPRHAGVGGLILRALDGRPEMWDWIQAYTNYHFNLWLKLRINNAQLYYGLREGAFMLHFAVWLAKALPDSYPLQVGGTATNGAQIRSQLLADVENVSVNYFGRLQLADGSWRWDDVDFVDPDGGTLKGITQPFMVGLLLTALVDVHQATGSATVKESVKNQILKGARNLYEAGPYRKDEPVPADTSKRWRSFWYFYYGGTTVSPTKYARGGGSYDGAQLWQVKSERQSVGTVVPAFAYAYLISRDAFFRTAGDELWSAAYGGEDGIRNEMDGTAKNYNQNARRGGSFQAWLLLVASPTPTPTPAPSPSPSPSPTPSPTPAMPTPTPQVREALDEKWPTGLGEQQASWKRLTAAGWNCTPAGSRIWCWRQR